MQEWWLSMDVFMRTMWIIAAFTSLVFIVQTILTFAGMDSGTDFDADLGGDLPDSGDSSVPFQLFTFRNFINFFLGFSWTGIALRPMIGSNVGVILLSTLAGVILVTLVMMLFKWLNDMQQSGNINLEHSAVGCKGTVYLTVPAERKGEGKVQISIQGAVREYNAVTDGDRIANGTPITVTEVINSQTLLVEELTSLII